MTIYIFAVMDPGSYQIEQLVTLADTDVAGYTWPDGTIHVDASAYPSIATDWIYNPTTGVFSRPQYGTPFSMPLQQYDQYGYMLQNISMTPTSGTMVYFGSDLVPVATTVAAFAADLGLAPVALSGAYSDLSGKPAIPSVARTTSTLSLSLVGTGATGTQISSTKDSSVRACISTSTTSTIGGPSTSVVALKICATNNATEGSWTTVATLENDQTITLALALNSIQVMKGQLLADVPAGWYVKLVNSGSGTHTEAFVSGQQTIYG